MNFKPKSLVIILLIGISSHSQSNTSINNNDWKLFVDDTIGYKIEYPKDWIAKGGKGGFMCGKQSGFKNAEWMLWLSKPENTERINYIFNHDGLYDGYDIIEKPISINGLDGIHTVITHKEKPKEYIEFIVIKTTEFWFQIENAGIKDEQFELFYNSFKIIK
ncbi:hypothetical protein [Psychroserpens jangbogonensis]|uniref:hypothetical protein n=1 Tax=Psychroserpens jangbogonensis TaxID=1484460 RepID=UPI00053EBBA4|nr:hypothetical protein [Psychroserpens jangbogonensis]